MQFQANTEFYELLTIRKFAKFNEF